MFPTQELGFAANLCGKIRQLATRISNFPQFFGIGTLLD
jgi:hypothetical protein